ncbi:MAG: ABC transporter permease, partial [Candidatus Acidiferrum sp.]
MSLQESVARVQSTLKEQPWRLFASQISVLVRNEVRRNLFTRRRIWVYLLALIPVIIFIIHNILDKSSSDQSQLESDTLVLAGTLQLYYFRLGIFFACMGIFTWLFRGEMVERTLHYQFLVPVRKEVLVVGKFLAGAIISILLFETSILACFYLTYARFGSAG